MTARMPSPMRHHGCVPIFALLLAIFAGCASSNESFEIKYASEYPGTPRTVSIFGVYQDGMMDEDAWTSVQTAISAAFQSPACAAGYGEAIRASRPELLSQIEKRTRDEGVTDELLSSIAPAAEGEAIATLEIHGRPPGRAEASGAAAPILLAHGGGPQLGSRPGLGLHGADAHPFEISASLFSVRLRHTVVVVSMTYTGASRSEAIAKLGQKLTSVLSGASCMGWNWGVASVSGEK